MAPIQPTITPGIGTTSSEGMPGGPYGVLVQLSWKEWSELTGPISRERWNSDTDKLLKLTQELDDEISRTTPNALTPGPDEESWPRLKNWPTKIQAKMTEFQRGGGLP